MSKLSKFFCVAVAGATCDGRTIDPKQIDEMAASYNPATYTARVNMEHIRGFSADPPFCAYGNVTALEARDVDLDIAGKTEKRRALFAQIDALDNLVALNAKGQKLFSSIEINPSFAESGKAYLQGLAVTDSPASLGTEVLQFAASQGDKNFLNPRKQAAGNHFSAAAETAIEFEEPAPEGDGKASAGLFAAATKFFEQLTKGKGEEAETPTTPAPAADPKVPANDNFGQIVAEGFTKLSAVIAAMSSETTAEIGKLRADHNTLKASIERTDGDGTVRPVATGAGNFVATDC